MFMDLVGTSHLRITNILLVLLSKSPKVILPFEGIRYTKLCLNEPLKFNLTCAREFK